MSKLDDLLQGVKVEWKQLDDIAQYIRGLTYNKTNESKDNSGLKVLRANNITLNNNSLNFDEIKYVNLNTKVKESQKLYSNDILISAASGSRDHVGKVAYINTDLDYYFGGFMGVVRSSSTVNSRYLFHILTSGIFKKYVDDALNTATINNLSSSMMNAFKIPIPCPDNPEKSLEIQQEIVRVLDELTSLSNQLTTELETERQNRKKQFEFFREQLFRFEESEAELKNLKDVAKISNGKDHKIFKDGSIPVYGSGGIMRYIDTSIYEEESVLIPRKGSIGNIFYVNEPFWTVDTIFYTKINIEIIIPKYFYYFLKTKDLKELNFAGGVPSLTKTVLDKIKIPIPPLAEQERIVKLLDQFDATHTAIEEEITKEIKLRTQQYEYYREKLLTFPKK